MNDSQKQLIKNLKKQLQSKRENYIQKSYIFAIQSVIPPFKNTLTMISGSSTLYTIDPINLFVEQHTMYPIDTK